MNPRDRLQYALYLQRLHELFVIKENIAFQYPNAHYNKAAEQIDKVVDKCLDNNIKAVVDGTHNLENPNLDHVISQALTSQQKMLVKTKDKYIQNAVEQNTKEFTSFIQNRIEKENYSLQAKIQKEYEKKKYKGMPEEEAKKLISEKFKDSARKRSKNIVKDALHTNQSQISWTYNVNNGMKYKVWMNGQSKSGVRYWHIKSKIQPVEIDDFFDIFGPRGHARMMYPGDLNGGAENVANCKCWLHYTNIAPSNLKKKGTIQINPNVNLENENATIVSVNTETNGKSTKSNDDKSTSSNKKAVLFTKIKNKIVNPFRKIFRSSKKNIQQSNKILESEGIEFEDLIFDEDKVRKELRKGFPKDIGDDAIDYMVDTLRKNGKSPKELGQIFNRKTGKPTSIEFKEDENGNLEIKPSSLTKSFEEMSDLELEEYYKNPEKFLNPKLNENEGPFAFQHNHPPNTLSAPSGRDVHSILSQSWVDHSVILNENEIWLINSKEKATVEQRKFYCERLNEFAKSAKSFAKSQGYEKGTPKYLEAANKKYSDDVEKFFKGNQHIEVYRVII